MTVKVTRYRFQWKMLLVGIYSDIYWYHETVCGYLIVKYGLVAEDEVTLSVVARGQVGAWRLAHYDTISSDSRVVKKITEEDEPFQPEEHGMIVTEIYKGEFYNLDD